jgi:hypothetical protein
MKFFFNIDDQQKIDSNSVNPFMLMTTVSLFKKNSNIEEYSMS